MASIHRDVYLYQRKSRRKRSKFSSHPAISMSFTPLLLLKMNIMWFLSEYKMQRVPEEEKFSIVFVQLLKSQTIELLSLFIVDNIRLLGIFLCFFYTYDFHTRESIRERNAVKPGRRDNRITMIAFSGAFSISIPLSPMESYESLTLAHRSLNRYLVYLFYFFCHVNAILFRETLPQQSYNKGGIISAALIVNFLEILFFFTSLFKRKTRLEVSARANFHDHF